MSYNKVDGHPDLIKHSQTGIVLNTNKREIEAARTRKKLWKQKQEQVDKLQEDVGELKQMMKTILEKLDGS